jgi:hypothetical protein
MFHHEKCSIIKLVNPNTNSSVFYRDTMPEPKYSVTTLVCGKN